MRLVAESTRTTGGCHRRSAQQHRARATHSQLFEVHVGSDANSATKQANEMEGTHRAHAREIGQTDLLGEMSVQILPRHHDSSRTSTRFGCIGAAYIGMAVDEEAEGAQHALLHGE